VGEATEFLKLSPRLQDAVEAAAVVGRVTVASPRRYFSSARREK
jgi:hypothetical protein